MGLPGNQILGIAPPLFSKTQSANTVIVGLIPPFSQGQGTNTVFQVDPGQNAPTGVVGAPLWQAPSTGFTRINKILYTSGATQHSVYLMRPLNWTYTTAASAKNVATLTIKDDPGIYSTKLRYPMSQLSVGVEGNVADRSAIASADYVAFQLIDGTWRIDTVSSYSAPTLTMTTTLPNVTGGGVAINTPVFLFGTKTSVDPTTGLAHPFILTKASTTREDLCPDYLCGCFGSLHRGDPLMILSDNATNAGNLDAVTAYYSSF